MSKSIAKTVSKEAADLYDDLVHSLRKIAKQLSEDTTDAVSEHTVALVQAAADLAERAKEQSKEMVGTVGQKVREHPAAFAALAAAAIAVAGLAVTRRLRAGA